jgi:diguanylate cyclase (GGDEF)-like protein
VDTNFDACTESLIAASRALEKDLQARFAHEFFQSMLGLTLDLDQSYEAWQQILARRAAAGEKGGEISFRQVMLDYFLNSQLLRDPVVTEFEELQRLRLSSNIDHLTRTHNRRFFDSSLAKEVPRAARYGHDLSLVLMDLNRFKDVNDTHGHAAGDQLLMAMGELLLESVRTSDYAFRIGGDEFALLLPQTVYPSAMVLAERVRQRFTETVTSLGLQVPVTIAYGVASSPREANDAKGLFALADQRMYDFKRSIGSPRVAPRQFVRIPLEDFGAYAVLRCDAESYRGNLVDFSFGGIGLRLPEDVELPDTFIGDLHLRVLPPVTVSLRKVYTKSTQSEGQRVGCAFFEPLAPQPALAL